MSNLFSLGRPRLVCFPWASSALFLTLHFHGLLLNSLGFPGPLTLSLILGVHGLAINLLLSLLSLLWAYRGPFSLFHIIYCPWFVFSLFPSSFKPIYLLKTHLFISRTCDLLFLPLRLKYFLSICQLFSVCVAGLLLSTWASKMAINTYEQASGQQLNWEKTALYFSCNTPQRHLGGHKGSIWGRNNISK